MSFFPSLQEFNALHEVYDGNIGLHRFTNAFGRALKNIDFVVKMKDRRTGRHTYALRPLGVSILGPLQRAALKRPYSPSGFLPVAKREVKEEEEEVEDADSDVIELDNNGQPV